MSLSRDLRAKKRLLDRGLDERSLRAAKRNKHKRNVAFFLAEKRPDLDSVVVNKNEATQLSFAPRLDLEWCLFHVLGPYTYTSLAEATKEDFCERELALKLASALLLPKDRKVNVLSALLQAKELCKNTFGVRVAIRNLSETKKARAALIPYNEINY